MTSAIPLVLNLNMDLRTSGKMYKKFIFMWTNKLMIEFSENIYGRFLHHQTNLLIYVTIYLRIVSLFLFCCCYCIK